MIHEEDARQYKPLDTLNEWKTCYMIFHEPERKQRSTEQWSRVYIYTRGIEYFEILFASSQLQTALGKHNAEGAVIPSFK